MNPLEKVKTGMAAEKLVTVTSEMTVGHVAPGMPEVYGTPMMTIRRHEAGRRDGLGSQAASQIAASCVLTKRLRKRKRPPFDDAVDVPNDARTPGWL